MEKKMKKVLFSEVYCVDEEIFSDETIKKAYYLGAYCKAIINNSYESGISKGNTTFKKWLSNQIINTKNLEKIFDKASHFQEKLQLGGKRLEDLSLQVTTYAKPSSKSVSKYTISYFFRKGFNEYVKFKQEQVENDAKVDEYNKKIEEQSNEKSSERE